MKKRRAFSILSLISLLGIAFAFQNCGQTPFGALSIPGESDSASSSGGYDEPNVVNVPYALLSSEQVFKSMASVTGTTINGNLTNEYNNRQSVLGGGYDLKLVTSPMLIAVTNLASSFCNETVNREAGQAAADRKFFSQVDFTKAIGQISDASFQATVKNLGQAFWGRSPSDLEMQILSEGRADFTAGYTDTEVKNAGTSKTFMLYTCTAMLASLETLSF